MKPTLNTLIDVITKADDIIAYVKDHPFEDFIYTLTTTEPVKMDNTPTLGVIAGSKAVTLLYQELKVVEEKYKREFCLLRQSNVKRYFQTFDGPSEKKKEAFDTLLRIDEFTMTSYVSRVQRGDFKPHDVDLFILNAAMQQRIDLHPLDVIYVKHKTIDELLASFDLSCCRAARDLQNNFHVSIQCLYNMLTGKVNLPKYLGSEMMYNGMVADKKKLNYKKCHFRIDKYTDRGYKFVYHPCDALLPCHVKQFTY